MEVHLFLDEDGFCEGWGSNKEEHSVPIVIEDEAVLNGIRKYRYLVGELVYDETKALIDAKESRREKAKKASNKQLEQGFTVTLAGEDYVYTYDDSSKAYLNKVYELATSGLIDEATFDFKKNGKDVSISVDKVNITELWLLSFLHEENLKKQLNEMLSKIDSAETIKGLSLIQ